MKSLYLLLIAFVLLSCGNERVLYLPKIENAKITEVSDVSHAYLFYDLTKTDSVDLNRKNLISTTNWLINVDKRLTLAQAIPKIKFLQEKKRNAKMHKNEAAKNFYTCNDTIIKSLGFLEFTDVVYIGDSDTIKTGSVDIIIFFSSLEEVNINTSDNRTAKTNINDLQKTINELIRIEDSIVQIHLGFKKTMSFQEYIKIKSLLLELNLENATIGSDELIN